MTVSVIYSDAADGFIESTSTVYETARAGSGMFATTADEYSGVGQAFYTPNYYIDQIFLSFDTSAIGTDDISAVALDLYGRADNSTTDDTVEVAAFDWGATVTTADWQDGTELAALTVLATMPMLGFSLVAYNTFTNTGSMIAAINRTGTTRFVLFGQEDRLGTTPTNPRLVDIWMADELQTGERRPRLTITHTAAVFTNASAENASAAAAAEF